jgi:CheY-like chemotaxis protein
LLNPVSTAGGHRRFSLEEVERLEQGGHQLGDAVHTEPAADSGQQTTLRQRVLIVDDDQQFRELMIDYLEDCTEVTAIEVADNGYSAGEKVFRFRPTVVLLDVNMPGLDGFQVCKKIKQDVETSAIRVIIVSGFLDQKIRQQLQQAGADSCLAKPFSRAELYQQLGINQ